MIQLQRDFHRVIWIILSVILIAGFIMALITSGKYAEFSDPVEDHRSFSTHSSDTIISLS